MTKKCMIELLQKKEADAWENLARLQNEYVKNNFPVGYGYVKAENSGYINNDNTLSEAMHEWVVLHDLMCEMGIDDNQQNNTATEINHDTWCYLNARGKYEAEAEAEAPEEIEEPETENQETTDTETEEEPEAEAAPEEPHDYIIFDYTTGNMITVFNTFPYNVEMFVHELMNYYNKIRESHKYEKCTKVLVKQTYSDNEIIMEV